MVRNWLGATLGALMLAACGGNDADGDGFSVDDGDCDDFAVAVNPDADEIPYNGVDDDCDSSTPDDDLDGDGARLAQDCDDNNAAVNPSADEICNDVDDDCDGSIDDDPTDGVTYYLDADGDGFGGSNAAVACESPGASYVETSDDCDDTDDDVYPGAAEICDGEDNDCDTLVDAADDNFDASQLGTWYADADNDGYGDPEVSQDACFAPDGFVDDDSDCNDAVEAINPGATETCNDTDDDCDTLVDEDAADASTWYIDVDEDGYGDSRFSQAACDQPDGYVADATDCDPLSPDVNPGATEVCNTIDDDCDGATDDADDSLDESTGSVFHADADGDGYGDVTTAEGFCQQPAGYVVDATDCNDGNEAVNPGAAEVCDAENVDEDCNTLADDADDGVDASTFTTFYADTDNDTYGDPSSSVAQCDTPDGFVRDDGDCNDADGAINPGATEVCDDADVDEDCDTLADDADDDVDSSGFGTFYADADDDTFGDAATTRDACDLPDGFVTNDTDCDDTNGAINPSATEICDPDDIDEDCDGAADDLDASVDSSGFSTFYADFDGDSFGDPAVPDQSCDPADGFVADDTDCNDAVDTINPGAAEVCDADDVDENCNGVADDADDTVDPTSQTTWYADADTDAYGDAAVSQTVCEQPDGFVRNDLDCNDGDDAINPEAAEICDPADVDEDCDGLADDADDSVDRAGFSTFYADSDTDGYGDPANPTDTCDLPDGFVTNDLDCNDTLDSVNPEADEVCDPENVDENCNGVADDEDDTTDPSGFTDFYADLDSDGFGAGDATSTCDAPTGTVRNNLDCDDTNDLINPDATEVCDDADVDEDCDGASDNDDDSTDPTGFTTFYEDLDSDTFGNSDETLDTCDLPAGYATVGDDCDDANGFVNPGEAEVCDDADVDEDCDGLADDADDSVDESGYTDFYADVDADTYGNPDDVFAQCDLPDGYSTDNADCDDTAFGVNPGATEVCDDADVDEDCDTLADDADDSVDVDTFATFYQDADDDGFGNADATNDQCDPGNRYIADDTDCDDGSATTFPGAAENEDDATACMLDSDGDGYGEIDVVSPVVAGTDCDDANADANPGVEEVRQNGVDDDCDGEDAPYITEDLVDGGLVITEVMVQPDAVTDANGEWFEIQNVSGGTANLENLFVANSNGDEFTVSGELLVQDGAFVVFGVNDDTTTNGGVELDYAYTFGGLSFDNAGSDLELYVNDDADELIDAIEWDDGTSYPWAAGETMQLTLDGTFEDNDDASSWCAGASSYGSGDLGTPGAENDDCSP